MDFYKNIDKLSDSIQGVSYNQILDVQRGAVNTEPVTLNELKEWAKVDGSADDAILTALIIAAREMCEKYTGVNFVQRQVTVLFNNVNGGTYLPYGPVGTITGVYDEDNNSIDYVAKGVEFKAVVSPRSALKAIYQGGYSTLPETLKTAVKAQALFLYENRGENNFTISPIAKALLDLYKR
jgi:hypothetical protein